MVKSICYRRETSWVDKAIGLLVRRCPVALFLFNGIVLLLYASADDLRLAFVCVTAYEQKLFLCGLVHAEFEGDVFRSVGQFGAFFDTQIIRLRFLWVH